MGSGIRPIKALGQHFLRDEQIAKRISDALLNLPGCANVLEIGPGTGMLTRFLVQRIPDFDLWCIEIDTRSADYLDAHFNALSGKIIRGDFLSNTLSELGDAPFSIAGNFPYYISTQILFRVLELFERVPQLVGMFQKEVAQRVAAGPGTKDYGIPSVLLQAHYDIEYLFTVPPDAFLPPPRVDSGVIRMLRKSNPYPETDLAFFRKVVKTAFGQRRKTMRNSLKPLLAASNQPVPYLDKRPEQLGWEAFVQLANALKPEK